MSKTIKLVPSTRTECHKAIENMASLIDDQTLFAGFVVLRKDRSINCGWSYDGGVGPTDMVGACEILREDIIKKEWP